MARLEIADIGNGFDLANTSEGLGLASMRERLRSISGTFTITSSPGHGTQVVAEVGHEIDAGFAKAG
jgi:signal transduction histidine kinase